MTFRLVNSGLPDFAQFFFNAIYDFHFIRVIYLLRYGIGVNYNGPSCHFPPDYANDGIPPFRGVAFSFFGEHIIVSEDDFDSMMKQVCETQKARRPEQSAQIDEALREPARYRQRSAAFLADDKASSFNVPSLFRQDSISTDISIFEDEWVELIEVEAHALEKLASTPKTSESSTREASLRRGLLIGLESRGLLSSDHAEAKLLWLNVWGMTRLISCFHAARTFEAYQASAARRSRFPEPAEAKPSVSLDWFRNGIEPPPGRDADEWLALCEHTLLDAIARGRITSSPPSYEGELFERTKSGWFELRWRRDDGETPVVVSARLS